MIKAENLTKRFYDTVAVDHIHAEIHNGSVFGLIGTNGAGKSTFLRMAAGILKPDEGSITVDDETVFENTKVKARCFYIPDEPYFLSNGTAEDMKVFYQGIYPKFDAARFDKLLKNFELESRRKVQTFSKGMKKQLAVLLGICAGTDYLFCDETFDGLDPVMRQTVKSLFANDIEERNLTPGAGRYLRPCRSASQGRNASLKGSGRYEVKYSQDSVCASGGSGEQRFAGNRYYKDGTEGKSPDAYRARKTGRNSDNFTGVSSGVF